MDNKRKLMTLCIIYDDSRVLLGMKREGLGEGRWNGYGGKVKEVEGIEQALHREIREETGVNAVRVRRRGVINFSFEDNPDFLPEVHLFSSDGLDGEPVETKEMAEHKWFSHSDIPYKEMWPADKYWIPLILQGKNVGGSVYFKDMNTVLSHSLLEI